MGYWSNLFIIDINCNRWYFRREYIVFVVFIYIIIHLIVVISIKTSVKFKLSMILGVVFIVLTFFIIVNLRNRYLEHEVDFEMITPAQLNMTGSA